MPTFVIEHLEEKVSKWVLVEYRHAALWVGRDRLWITNVRRRDDMELLSSVTDHVYRSSIADMRPRGRIIVLDPAATEPLEPEDFSEPAYVVVGGIMGDFPPRGRTRTLLTSRIEGAVPRTLGRGQFSVDGAVIMALWVSQGRRLEEIETVEGVEIMVSEHHSVYLPYTYPAVRGFPIIPRELADLFRDY